MIFRFHSIFEHCKQRKIYLLSSMAAGFFGGVIYILCAPKIYEVTTFLSLPYTSAIDRNGVVLKNSLNFFPPPNEVQKQVTNPLNITDEMLSSCGMDISNANRKKLVNSLRLNAVDKDDRAILLRVHLEGKANASKCAVELIQLVSKSTNQAKDRYISNLKASGIYVLINQNSAVSDKLIVSDSYIYPRPILNILLGALAGLLLAIFGSWVKYQVAKVGPNAD